MTYHQYSIMSVHHYINTVLLHEDFRQPRTPCTRDSFSRAWPSSLQSPLIFLHCVSAALPSTSDKGQCVNFGRGPIYTVETY